MRHFCAVQFSVTDEEVENRFVDSSGIDRSIGHHCRGREMAAGVVDPEIGFRIDSGLAEFARYAIR